jgi:hypothetical protein
MPAVKLRAGYTDGHVGTYSPSEATPMRIGMTPEGVPPFPDVGPTSGLYYIPNNALR